MEFGIQKSEADHFFPISPAFLLQTEICPLGSDSPLPGFRLNPLAPFDVALPHSLVAAEARDVPL